MGAVDSEGGAARQQEAEEDERQLGRPTADVEVLAQRPENGAE